MEARKEEFFEEERLNTVKSSVFYLAFALCLGLPIWWHTTTVYRAQLPETQVKSLLSKTVQLRTNVYVDFVKSQEVTEDFKDQLASLLQYELAMSASVLKSGEAAVKFEYEVLRKDVVDANEVSAKDGHINLQFDLLDEDQEVSLENGQLFHAEVDPDTKTAHLFLADLDCDLERLIADICSFIKVSLLQEDVLNYEYVSNIATQVYDFSKQQGNREKKEKEKLLSTKRVYDIVLTLINPEPDNFKRHLIKWNIQSAISEYLNPYLNRLSHVANFSVASQNIYQVKLGAFPKFNAASGDKKEFWTLSEVDTPRLITPVERKIGFTSSNNSVINLVVYLAPSNHNPMYFVNKNNQLKTLSYYRGWGALLLHSVNQTLVDRKELVSIDAAQQIASFIPVINDFLGVKQLDYAILKDHFKRHAVAITQLQLDNLYRQRILHNVATSVSTMDSLISLCDQVKNMVIRDEIKENLEKAVELIENVHKSIGAPGSLTSALSDSSVATELAEEAFSDPTILAMLYFPEDQKYAIYVPMFVPMSMPLWSSLGIVMGYLKARKSKVQLAAAQ